MLDDKLWLYPYNSNSESAILLSDKLDIWRIKRQGSNFKGRPGRVVINWGNGTDNWNPVIDGAEILNKPHKVDESINKIDFFKNMSKKNGPRIPFWTTDKDVAASWLRDHIVIARQRVEGMDGDGLVIVKSIKDFIPARLYTILIESVAEYRCYMFGNNVVDCRVKQVKRGQPQPENKMRVGDNWVYNPFLIRDLPQDVIVQANTAMPFTGLLFGGFDVLWDGHKAWILEMNTAPYLGENTANIYADKFRDYVLKRA